MLFLLPLLLFFACGSSNDWQKGRAEAFSKGGEALSPSFRIYHPSVDSTVIFIKVDHDQLLYTRSRASDPFRAELKVKFKLRDREGELLLTDSTSLTDEGKDEERSIGRLPFRWEREPKKGWLEIKARDMKRDRTSWFRKRFDRDGPNARQNFVPIHPEKGDPFFRNYFSETERIGLRYERSKPERLHVRAYVREFPLPPPPFATDEFRSFDYSADSIFTFSRDSAHLFEVPVPDTGFYHLQVDTAADRKGFSYFDLGADHPKVTSVEKMLGPIRYLTSEDEFEQLERHDDLKAAVDSFWVAKGGSHERARKLIEAYYGRVERANRFFTSHVAGWKTDRGLVHVIFGEPERVIRDKNGEKWVYGTGDGRMRLTFEFERVENPFTTEDMSLERHTKYKRPWYQAVEAWRNGRIYSH